MKHFIVFFLFIVFPFIGNATHIMGGEITWKCQGNQYVFELTVYRDCNQTNITSSQELLRVWNHPSLSTVTVFFDHRQDISPTCRPVNGSATPFACGSGSFTGNGTGAIEKVVFKSQPITIVGTPPTNGWIFTFDSFSRNASVSNLQNPSNYGITMSATIFAAGNTECIDQSAQFQETPFIITCKGTPFTYNMNAFDPDGDSLVFSVSKPLNNIQNAVFNPPIDPIELPFETNFSYTSPTPGTSFDPQNQPFNLNPVTGAINFTSHTIGNFVVKVIVSSYKNGVLYSTIQREFQVIVINCLPDNDPPILTNSIPGTTSTIDVIAGDLVQFEINATDYDLLQDGQNQTVTLSASGNAFGTNFTSNSGCSQPPCAQMSEVLPVMFQGTKQVDFSWQTTCDHLLNNGILQNERIYTFVFKAIDDYCQIPKFKYETINVRVINPQSGIQPAIQCINVLANGDYQLTLENTSGLTVPFFIRNQQNTVVATITNAQQTTVTIPAGTHSNFHIAYTNGCSVGGALSMSAPANVIDLVLQNPQNGTAILQWNAPANPMNGFGSHYYIYKEYPAGNWQLIDSVPTTTTVFRDTISVCKAFMNYQVGIKHGNCMYTSTIKGDTLLDRIAPMMPQIASVSIDTLTGNAVIEWVPNSETDTYGYIIYKTNDLGILYEIDTIFGRNNTSFTHITSTDQGPVTYSISAFDSCFTLSTPITYQTSAKSALHTSIFLSYNYNSCRKEADLTWTNYVGWNTAVSYEIYQKASNGWNYIQTVSATNFTISLAQVNQATICVRGINGNGQAAFSNVVLLEQIQTQAPGIHYTRVASVDANTVIIKHDIQVLPYMTDIVIERKKGSQFIEIGRAAVSPTTITFVDSDKLNTKQQTYTYRVLYVDSCGNVVNPANEVTTVLAEITSADEIELRVTLDWSPYLGYDGNVIQYEVFRSINGVYEWPAVYTTDATIFHYQDQLDETIFIDGKVCYRVLAKEGQNRYGFAEESFSNETCHVFEPLIYIPNAFTPNGVNPIFFPVVNLANINEYQLLIYDRWNNIIFTSSDYSVGWDGVMNSGQKAPFGLYGYQLRILDGNGKEIRKNGHVSLIRSTLD